MHQGKPLAVAVAALLEEPQALLVAGGCVLKALLLTADVTKQQQRPARAVVVTRPGGGGEALVVAGDRLVEVALLVVGEAEVAQDPAFQGKGKLGLWVCACSSRQSVRLCW